MDNKWKLKEKPSHFRVFEVPSFDLNKNKNHSFLIFKLIKKDYSQTDVIERLSNFFGVNRNDIGFSGIKDRRAITEQYISIDKNKVNRKIILDEKIVISKYITIKLVGSLKERLYPGRLKGNRFKILIKNVDKDTISKLKEKNNSVIKMPNYFGNQRFKWNNFEIGLFIFKREYKKALDLIKETGFNKNIRIINKYYNGKNEIEVLKKFPKRFFKLYLHSVQSKIFNEILASKIKGEKCKKKVYCGNFDIEEEIPLIGHDTEDDLSLEIMSDYDLIPFDFINKQISYATLHEKKRISIINTKLKVSICEDNNSFWLEFFLPKGSYATELIETLKSF